jgi:hypothetical protein
MKRLVILSVFVVIAAASPAKALAQMQIQQVDDPPRRVMYWEAGGNAQYSANVDVLILSHTSVRAGGLVFIPIEDTHVPWSGIVMVNQLFGGHGHYLEVGVGTVAMHLEAGRSANGSTATIGYRLQTRRSFARIGLTPAPPRPDRHRRGPTFGLSLGAAF